MSNSQPGPASGGRSTAGRNAVVAIVIVVLVAVALLAALALGSPRTGPPSLAGQATGSPTGSEPDASAAASAAASSLAPSASPAPTVKPTAKPTARPTPRPTQNPSTKPAIASYQIPSSADCGGSRNAVEIPITWVVQRATGVTISIDGPGIYKSYKGATGLAMVPFACGAGDTKHTYTLTTTGGTGPAAHVTKTVKRTG